MISAAFSPCPNDTFLFGGWVQNKILSTIKIDPFLTDIDHLNKISTQALFPLIKLSFPQLNQLSASYQLLPIGAAVGFQAGPKLISSSLQSIQELRHKTIAIPGAQTTAHLLLNHFLPFPYKKHFCLYHEIIPLLQEKKVDAGVLIHETRFVFKNFNMIELADFGELWEKKYHLPLPLGCLAILKKIPSTLKTHIVQTLQSSLAYAQTYPEKVFPYILQHSQEKDRAIIQKHLDTYVTSETRNLSPLALASINTLLGNDTVSKECFL